MFIEKDIMTDPIHPKEPLPPHMSLEKTDDGETHLVFKSGNRSKEVTCKVVDSGFFGRLRSIFLGMIDWVEVPNQSLNERNIHVFIKQSDLKDLEQSGLNISVKITDVKTVSQAQARVNPISQQLAQKISDFYKNDDDKVDYILARIQNCVDSGGKKLNLEGLLSEEGECPDIFEDPLFERLEELKLTEAKQLPDSLGSLKNLKRLDLSSADFVYLPECIQSLSQLESLNLSESAMTKRESVIKAGKEYLGGMRSQQEYQDEGSRLLAKDLFAKLKPCSQLKSIKMASSETFFDVGAQLQQKFEAQGKKDIVSY